MTLTDILFDLPTWLGLAIYILVVVVLALVGLVIYISLGIPQYQCSGDVGILSIFVSIIAVFLGVIISLIIAQANSNYAAAIADATLEANGLYTLWNIVKELPNSELLQVQIIGYLQYVIHVEYPALKNGDLPENGDKIVGDLASDLMAFGKTLTSPTDLILWETALGEMNNIQTLRLQRLTYASYGVNNILWWVTILDSMILIILTWFIKCDTFFRYIYVAIAAIYVAASLFAVTIISYPFRGYAGLTPIPFEQAYTDIVDGPPVIHHIPLRDCDYRRREHHQKSESLP